MLKQKKRNSPPRHQVKNRVSFILLRKTCTFFRYISIFFFLINKRGKYLLLYTSVINNLIVNFFFWRMSVFFCLLCTRVRGECFVIFSNKDVNALSKHKKKKKKGNQEQININLSLILFIKSLHLHPTQQSACGIVRQHVEIKWR